MLVWGALGFIGFHLVERLLSDGYKVSVLCRSRARYAEPHWASKVTWYSTENEVCQTSLQAAVASASVIFDLAGSSGAVASNHDPIGSLDSNCRVQLEFLEACAKAAHKPHVIFSSSRLVYGETSAAKVDEKHATRPLSIYAVHKLCIENYLELYSRLGAITHTVCRISNAYGHDCTRLGQGYKIVNSFIIRSLAQLPIVLFGTGEQIRDFIYIDDLTEILIRCALIPAASGETFNIGSGVGHSMMEAAEIIRELTDGPPINFHPWPEDYLAVESGNYVAEISKSHRVLQFLPQFDFCNGINSTITKYRLEQALDLLNPEAAEHVKVMPGAI